MRDPYDSRSIRAKVPVPPPPLAWSIRVGAWSWIAAVHNGSPVLTSVDDQAQQWATEGEARAVLDALPPADVDRAVVQRPRR